PTGNSFDRDPDGTPNGVIRAGGSRLLKSFRNSREDNVPFEDEVQGYLKGLQNYAQKGITSIGIAGSNSMKRYQVLRDLDAPVRMAMMYSVGNETALRNLGIQSGFGDDRLRISAIKVFHGNSMSGNTCWVSEPFEHRPGYYGIPPSRTQAELDSLFQELHNGGFQIATHSNGDREIDMTLAAIERAQANNPRPDPRHRIEHASVMTLPLLERAKKAGVILVFHSYMYEHGDKLDVYGEKRLEMVHPYRTAIDMGILVAGHSDSPVATACPMLCIHDMVNRRGENGKLYGGSQRITVEEAIKVWTLDGAYTTFEEHEKGSITPGKLADFVVLRKDPRKVAVEAIKDIVIDATYMGGKNVWQAP
ncbi:MAG: amidohydrolase family protein, partial [Bacteroidales bacterium]|nr:amidohydrolase family protein [Bacteroidales bacterium]